MGRYPCHLVKKLFLKPDGITIIICGYNAANRIEPTLRALQQQQFSGENISWEVLLVDNASTDNTAKVAADIWEENPVTRLKIVREEKPGLMNARHKGLATANYDIVSFIDDDNWVEEKWVVKVFNVFCYDEKIGACGGSSEAVFENVTPAWFSEYENNFAVGRQANESGFIENKKGFLWGAGLSFRKSLWTQLEERGFKNLTTGREGKNIYAGEDTELCYAFRLLGYRLYYKEDLTLKHFMPAGRMNFSYFEKMNVGFGKANARLNCYRVLLNSGNFKLRPWWYEWAVAIKQVLKYTFTILFTSNERKKNNAKVNRAYWKGYASQMMQDRGRLKSMIEEIRKVFNSI